MNAPLDKLLKPEDVAKTLSVDTRTLANWRYHRRHPELTYIKVGGLVRYTAEAVQAFLKARTRGGAQLEDR